MQLRSEPDPRRFCTADGKYIFPTAQDAMAASKRKGQGVVPYTCEDKFWHIGHQIKRNRDG